MKSAATPKIIQKLPLTQGQQAIWMIHKLSPDTGIYNSHFVWNIPDHVNISLLKKSLVILIQRHPVLRTLYQSDSHGVVCQHVYETLPLSFEEIDGGDLDDEALKPLLDQHLHRAFDLESEMPMRWVLLKRKKQPNVLAQFLHHISVDLWSGMILLNELKITYAALLNKQELNLPVVDKSFKDFVDQEQSFIQGPDSKRQENYWHQRLAGMTQALDIPSDYIRPQFHTCNKEYFRFRLDVNDVRGFNQLALTKNSILFSQYLLAFQILVSRYCQTADIAVGGPTAGRNDSFRGVYGYFTNAVVFRSEITPTFSFNELIEKESRNIAEAIEAQDYPFPLVAGSVLENRDTSRAPVVQIAFVWENINRFENRDEPMVSISETNHQLWDMGEMGTWTRHIRLQQLDNFDLTFKIYKYQNDFVAGIEYNSDLYTHATMERMAEHYAELLHAIVENPDLPICEISLLSPKEKQTLLIQWNKTKSYYNLTHSLPYFVEKHAAKNPDAFAIMYDSAPLSYKALDIASNRVANFLIDAGHKAEPLVGVFLNRSPAAIISLLGIMKAGAVYLPLDPDYPSDRLGFIIEDANPAFIISDKNLTQKLLDVPKDTEIIDIDSLEIHTQSDSAPHLTLLPEQLAYVIYTSGSTGKPKGTMIDHKGLCGLMHAQKKLFKVGLGDNVLQFASLNFDASIFEIVMALSTGACLHIGRRDSLLGEGLLKYLRHHEIHWTVLPPALLTNLTPEQLPDLKTLIVAGDACSAELAKKWSEGRQFFNAYGPTETTIWATIAQVDGSEAPPIGKPIPNTQTYILDAHLNPQPIGIPGELHIGGVGLARGYLNRPDLTAEKFIANPFSKDSASRLYKTGDLCRYREDGNIEFLGRIDHQVKIRGFRVELGEIESVLREHSAVHDVLVMARDDLSGQPGGEKQLVAYVVKNASEEADGQQLRDFLKAKLPDYMVPAAVVVLDAFPLTPNEKIDRKALPLPNLSGKQQANHLPPRNEIERMIARVWQACLGISEISITENFFDLGGHSLLLAQVHSRLPDQLKENLSMVDLFKYPTIQALAHYLEKDEEEDTTFVEQDNHTERLRLRRRLMESLGGVKVAIVGMAGRFPGADNVEAFWQNICDKKESITFFSADQLRAAGVPEDLIKQPNYVPAKGMLDSISGFEAPFFNFTPREAQITDPQQRLFLECSWEALEDAACVPAEFDGRIGVYAGIGMNQYLMSNLSSHPELLAQLGDYPVMIGNDKDFLSTRVSYKLNLNGPAVVLQTACSTSLVAVHTACQALLNQDCDAALAGGVSFGRLGKSGYIHQEGMIMSADGHCRAFDAAATGTVQGQGCGVVLLKRLDDALSNNDHIYAVISGSATNNDGSNKTGYTAPSVDGQAKAIHMAQASAMVSPSEISYIEAHGTGTPIGDPIEIEALRQAFTHDPVQRPKSVRALNKTGRCAIGSVKTNIGHLDAASGIAGLIKTAKALEAKKLPPSLHFKTPNPKIDFSNTPFYVNTELQDWNSEGLPRYAAVSSFGIGGSNAHIVLTDAPNQTPTENARPWRIITLSARTPSALEAMTERFVTHLKTHKEQSFANMCYTLHVGRTLFPYRRYLVCRNRDEAISELSPVNHSKVVSSKYIERPRKLIFMFSGQGSQYQNMGEQLYRTEITFRKAIDECRAKLRQKFIHIYEELSESDYHGFTDKIHQTYITQPGLFIFEYAMSKMLMSWGIEPDLMVGHSIGEYVAACLAGVFTLDQALELVTIRGHLIQGLESGDMLSVNLSEEEAQRLTNHDVSVAAVNGEKRCVLSGSANAIQYLHKLLDRQGIDNRILHTSHAFHSHMMEPILERFRGYIERRKPQPPTRPFVSSLTGELITDELATSPQYWTDHLRYRVRFHKAMNTVFAQRKNAEDTSAEAFIFLEMGPGRVLTTLIRQHASKQPQDWALTTTHNTYENTTDAEHLLNVVARLWEQGIKIDWKVFHSHRQRYRVSMPTYPFERKQHWIKARKFTYEGSTDTTLAQNVIEAEQNNDMLLQAPVSAPGDAVEQQVWQLWSKALGLTEFSITDDFFELGGDSLLAVGLADQLQSRFSIPVASHVLMQKPNVAALAEFIRQNNGKSSMPDSIVKKPTSTTPNNAASHHKDSHNPLVLIQSGAANSLPLILVHPIGGEVFFYRDLARYLGKDQTVYAFQAPSLSGHGEPISSVPIMAELYISELKKQGINGPYCIGGSSFGGLVAYEMAQQLSGHQEEVCFLLMIDTPAPEQMPQNLTDSAAILQYLLEDKLTLSIENLRQLDESAQISYVLDQARIQGKSSSLPAHLSVSLFKTWMAHQRATVAYKPQPYASDVMFFRHSEPIPHFPPLPHLPWQALVKGVFSVHQVPGNHISMNHPPHVQVLASHLKPALEAVRRTVEASP
ncbi:MAG: amino acid adenylation domain-containing protein [Hahellaceae bacterium]|nr:amino acid adenylation domain-containing protein [Hahellaceae bacterium]MCP5211486.1 amino acid adenylation domain-containing protein [Hahellaceae bacterium]